MTETISDYWFKLKKLLKLDDKKKKSYTTNIPDLISIAYLLLFYSIVLFIGVKTLTNSKFAFPILFIIPAFIGIVVFYIVLPIRLLNFIISQVILFFYLRNIKKNIPSETVIVTGKSEYKSPSFWFNPNYDLDLIFLLEYLKLKKEDFSVYKNVNIETLDKVMSDYNIRTVYIVGHGRRHGFVIDANTMVDYCRYNDPRYRKNFVYQIHCNSQKGTSLVEYVVDEKNRKECLPEHGYISSLTIIQMFIDKIIEYKNYGKFKKKLAEIWYNFLAFLVPYFALLLWLLIFTIIVG